VQRSLEAGFTYIVIVDTMINGIFLTDLDWSQPPYAIRMSSISS
jgi:hypothetical protein